MNNPEHVTVIMPPDVISKDTIIKHINKKEKQTVFCSPNYINGHSAAHYSILRLLHETR